MSEEYQEMFEEETREQIEKMNENLLALEDDPKDIELIEEIYRASHTLKGMAGTMGYDGIQKISHRMEELFDKLKGEGGKVEEELFDLLFECVDTIEILASGEDEDYGHLVNELNELIEGGEVTKEEGSTEEEVEVEESEEIEEIDVPDEVQEKLKEKDENS